MPFTFSHPAIVLPLLKINPNFFSATGLIIGSMSPDLEYFVRMKIGTILSHKLTWIPFFELPLALLFCFLFHIFVRNILIDHMPEFFIKRFIVFKKFDWISYFRKHYIVVVISILIGAYSHVFWDSFTHETGFFVEKFKILQEVWISKLDIKGYKFLQHASTLIGGLIILNTINKLPKHITTFKRFSYSFWVKISTLSILITIVRFLHRFQDLAIGNVIVSFLMSVFLSMMFLSFRNYKKWKIYSNNNID